MSEHTEIVPYRWNNLDRICAIAGVVVTPYKIPPLQLNAVTTWTPGALVEIPLGLTSDPAYVARFFRRGYEWVDVPEGVQATTLLDLFYELYQLDNVKFAHLDPVLVEATAMERFALDLKAIKGSMMTPQDPAYHNPDPALTAAFVAMEVLKTKPPQLLPYEDLIRLHFEYWDNSMLRADLLGGAVGALVAPHAPTFAKRGLYTPHTPLHWPKGSWLDSLVSQFDLKVVPFQTKRAKLEKVLARLPLQGTPIKSTSTQKGKPERPIVVMTIAPPLIELDGFSTQTLAPFYLREWQTGSSKIRFRLTLPRPALETRIEILQERTVIYAESHTDGEYLAPGTHIWSWDGYDADQVLDTTVLKSRELRARLTVTDVNGRTFVAVTELGTGPDVIRWADARIDRNAKTIDLTVFAQYSNPSDIELPSIDIPLPPAVGSFLSKVANGGMLPGTSLMHLAPEQGLPYPEGTKPVSKLEPAITGDVPALLNDGQFILKFKMPAVMDLDAPTFAQFKGDIIYGIGHIWSRSVTIDGTLYDLRVTCKERPTDSVRTLLAKDLPTALNEVGLRDKAIDPNTGKLAVPQFDQGFGSRSVNLAALVEGLPIIDIWDEQQNWAAQKRTDDNRYVGAHELGHSVLREAYGSFYSITHKGSSTVGQQNLMTGPAVPPPPGLRDVMYYWRINAKGREVDAAGKVVDDHEELAQACEDDARALVWLCRVVFG